jgi:hypothetical protein
VLQISDIDFFCVCVIGDMKEENSFFCQKNFSHGKKNGGVHGKEEEEDVVYYYPSKEEESGVVSSKQVARISSRGLKER